MSSKDSKDRRGSRPGEGWRMRTPIEAKIVLAYTVDGFSDGPEVDLVCACQHPGTPWSSGTNYIYKFSKHYHGARWKYDWVKHPDCTHIEHLERVLAALQLYWDLDLEIDLTVFIKNIVGFKLKVVKTTVAPGQHIV